MIGNTCNTADPSNTTTRWIMTGINVQNSVRRRNMVTNKMQDFPVNVVRAEICPVSNKVFEALYNRMFINKDGIWTEHPQLWGIFLNQLAIRNHNV